MGKIRENKGETRRTMRGSQEVHYSVRLSGYMDRTWIQLMCCAYSDILSLYFRWRDRLRFGWNSKGGGDGDWAVTSYDT